MELDPRPSLHPSSSGAAEIAPLIFVTYKAKINAIHRLWSSQILEAANQERYGQAMNLHGHVYTFKVTFRGPICKKTGQVIGADLLEDVINMAVVEVLDGKNLEEISWFLNRPSTLENVCLFVWRNIAVIMKPHPHDVDEVKVKVSRCWRGSHGSKTGAGGTSMEATYRGEMIAVDPGVTLS